MELGAYIQTSGPLFEEVQSRSLFSDAKLFPDSYPLIPPQELITLYNKKKKATHFNLKTFITKHFVFPEKRKYPIFKGLGMEQYIEKMWDILEQRMTSPSPYSTLIELPEPHIIPGGRFRECFYWDSYFVALGLLASGQIKRVKNMVINFAFLINRLGFIPNGNRVYFASRSQPPYFSHLLKLLLGHVEEDWVLSFTPQLETEYAFWMQGAEQVSPEQKTSLHVVRIDHETILNRYYDRLDFPRPEAYRREKSLAQNGAPVEFFRALRAVCASGWDFSSRWFSHPKEFKTVQILDIVPVDLNCLLYHLEKTLADFSGRLKAFDKERLYSLAAQRRKESIQRTFWNQQKRFYFDYNFQDQKHTSTWSLAGTFPLFDQIALAHQAEAVAKHLKKRFLFEGGFTTSLYEGEHQWDHPNGWAPLQWITISSLLNYGKNSLAKEATERWLRLNTNMFNQTGKMLEKYNVHHCFSPATRGEYHPQEGFGWTNGVALALSRLQKSDSL